MHSMTLIRMLNKGMLPTPMAGDWKGANRPESMTASNGIDRTKNMRNIYIHLIHQYDSKTSQLNPLFVAEMMGFPPNWTELPFQNGKQNLSKDMEMQ